MLNPNVMQRVRLVARSAFGALRDPRRADLVATLGEVSGTVALRRLEVDLLRSETGRRLLSERPEVTEESLRAAGVFDLPRTSLGGAYAEFMGEHGFSADQRDPVRHIEDERLAYVALRYRQTHDFWHVVCGLPPTVLGEISLKWFEMVQTGLPMCSLAALVGPLRLSATERLRLLTMYAPWAARYGKSSVPMISVPWESYLTKDLSEVRHLLRIYPAPPQNA